MLNQALPEATSPIARRRPRTAQWEMSELRRLPAALRLLQQSKPRLARRVRRLKTLTVPSPSQPPPTTDRAVSATGIQPHMNRSLTAKLVVQLSRSSLQPIILRSAKGPLWVDSGRRPTARRTRECPDRGKWTNSTAGCRTAVLRPEFSEACVRPGKGRWPLRALKVPVPDN